MNGADGTPVPFCPAQGAVLVRGWQQRRIQRSQLKIYNIEGPRQLPPVQSLRKELLAKQTLPLQRKIKKITENGTLVIYCIYFLYIYI